MAKLFNLARMSTATTGTGTITLGVAVSGYLSFSGAGVSDQDIVSYAIKDGSNSENGTGLYTSSGTTLTRNVAKSTNSNNAINLSGTAEVFITPRAEDLQPAIPGQLFGLTLSTAGSSSTFSVASGRAADGTGIETMILASSISKTTGSWAVGSGNGGLDSGTIAANTWYHAHLIKRADTGVVDALVSLSGSSPALPTNYTWSRRIGSMKTDGSKNWTTFYQNGDTFLWSVPVTDHGASDIGTTATLIVLTVPIGIRVKAIVSVYVQSANTYMITSPDQADTAPTGSLFTHYGNTAAASINQLDTDTSAQIRARGQAASLPLFLNTMGWIDRRGRD